MTFRFNNSVSVLSNKVYKGKRYHENAQLPNGVVNDFDTEEECKKYIDETYTKEQIEARQIRVRVWSNTVLTANWQTNS